MQDSSNFHQYCQQVLGFYHDDFSDPNLFAKGQEKLKKTKKEHRSGKLILQN